MKLLNINTKDRKSIPAYLSMYSNQKLASRVNHVRLWDNNLIIMVKESIFATICEALDVSSAQALVITQPTQIQATSYPDDLVLTWCNESVVYTFRVIVPAIAISNSDC